MGWERNGARRRCEQGKRTIGIYDRLAPESGNHAVSSLDTNKITLREIKTTNGRASPNPRIRILILICGGRIERNFRCAVRGARR